MLLVCVAPVITNDVVRLRTQQRRKVVKRIAFMTLNCDLIKQAAAPEVQSVIACRGFAPKLVRWVRARSTDNNVS